MKIMFRSQLVLEDRIMAQQSNCLISLLWGYCYLGTSHLPTTLVCHNCWR